ncbi:LysR family transcriptional regulator [Streptacidiphilus sp. P02-A3a]|uniref:LysR family transcriptional regulator n=1 Tax=Streptacidiphilus sp. P02-A3a TaxID=2704468 RepID=UPI0015FA85EB|nr:LysR family transcriptional regulator [Streptacidiphilus sp. P02-A3a]QMU70114.1 LysR family transcriptional regulator [Streptacidiphilus sp. P02-A3a]QMU70433.1 LysR family transcriptional regulator [Streptacidiphilus sp. P02-A3a]
MDLEPRRLVVLHTVQQAGGIAAAARLLGISASAVSQTLRRLEREAGAPLLDRTEGRAELTRAGLALAAYGGRIAEELAAAERELAGTGAAGVQGPVSIGAVLAVLTTLAARATASLAERYPQLRPRLCETSRADGLRALRQGALDVLLITGDQEHRPSPPPDCGLRVLAQEQYRVGVPSAWGEPPAGAAALAAVPWIGAPDGSARAWAHARLAAELGLPQSAAAHRATNWSAAAAMVRAGLGAVVLPGSVASRTAGLTLLPVPVPGTFETLALHRLTAPGQVRAPVAAVLTRLAEVTLDVAEELSRAGLLEREPVVRAVLT